MGSGVTKGRARSRGSSRPRPRWAALRFAAVLALLFTTALTPLGASASSDSLQDVLPAAGAGLGLALRAENSPYRGGGVRNDFLPLYLYEGKVFYLHAYRAGLKLGAGENQRVDLFLAHRFEGFPYDRVPTGLAGMAERAPGVDAGLSFERTGPWGRVFVEWLHDVSGSSTGNELKLGYGYDWRSGGLRLQPYATVSARDARLNDYYYGVRPDEAVPGRPAYAPGAGINTELGLYATYNLTQNWRLLGGIAGTRWSSGVRGSPIVNDRVQLAGTLGFLYDFDPEHQAWPDGRRLIVKAMHGKSTDCNLVPVMRLSCTSTQTTDNTGLTGLELGRPFVERLNGWPLDFVGYIGAIRHQERGLQSDFWEGVAFMKAYYYGFPWSDHVRTRIGFGAGLSYTQKVPFVEVRDQARRGRNTSKLLNYLDPSIDISLGDIFGSKRWSGTYFGFGASHRSGIFGTSEIFGNVNGGSNYIYSYVEVEL